MPVKLSSLLSKLEAVPNSTNAALLGEFLQHMKDNGSSEKHQCNELQTLLYYAGHLGKRKSFMQVRKSKQITTFLDTKKKPEQVDPDKKWITTWNDYLGSIKHFFRWLHNQRGKKHMIQPSEWKTPAFAQIKKTKTKRVSPYSETEIWDRDEILTIVKYQPYARNKAALTLFWDLNARNHEVTLLKLKNVRMRERWAEGEVPFQAKTGSGPILLTCSFPFVRDWLNQHPNNNDPEARLICNLYDGSPVNPEAMWSMMKQLRKRIARLLKKGEITDPKEQERLEYLLRTKKWNPYCIRHSSITYDSTACPSSR